jgi:hypothetical protein
MRLIQKDVHELAKANGWWEGKDITVVPEKLMLIVSEVAEALEEYRNGKPLDEVYYPDATNGYIDPDSGQYVDWAKGQAPEWKPEGFGVELADAIIRILDLAEFLGLNMEDLVQLKHQYNRTREYRHGGKLA